MKLKNIELKVLKTDADVNLDMALDMLGVINENNNAGKKNGVYSAGGSHKAIPDFGGYGKQA